MKMNNIEDYQNLVELLKQALEFYEEKTNYDGDIYHISKIAMDNGSQARFALEKIRELEEIHRKIHDEFEKFLTEDKQIDFINNVNAFKEIFGDNGNQI